MSILIKGMEMPKNEPLLVKINPDGTVSTTAKDGYGWHITALKMYDKPRKLCD